MTIGKTIALTRWTFVGKVMSLLLSRLVMAFTVLYTSVGASLIAQSDLPAMQETQV